MPVRVRGLIKRYGERNVVDGIDLDIEPGKVFGFLGPNGAGKSTTIDILTGTRPRTAGEVSVLGQDPAHDKTSWRSRIGVVPQSTGTFSEVSVREILTVFASFYPQPLPVDQVISMVGLTEKSKAKTESLSGGQKRRLDVAIGVIGNPSLIFLDEPTTGLDPVARREAWELVRYFGERGTTTILTTHYLDEVQELADKAAVIAGGKIIAHGTLAELGRQGSHHTQVRFSLTGSLLGHPLPQLRGLPPLQPDAAGMVSFSTDTPSEAAYSVLSWARELGVREVPDFAVINPTLEDVYLALVAGSEQRNWEADQA